MRVILQSKTHSINAHTMKIIPPASFNIKNIYLTSVSIPFTFYNVRETNNNIIINSIEVNLTVQNYNSIQLASALQTLISSQVNGIVTVSFNKQKLKYTITTDTEFTINFNTAYKLFGFHRTDYTITSIKESDFIGDINDGIHSLILTANFGTVFSTLYNDQFGTQIIARIPIENRKTGDMINYTDENNQRPIASNINNLQYFEITLYDDDFKPLQLNGVDYQIELFLELKDEITKENLTRNKPKPKVEDSSKEKK